MTGYSYLLCSEENLACKLIIFVLGVLERDFVGLGYETKNVQTEWRSLS